LNKIIRISFPFILAFLLISMLIGLVGVSSRVAAAHTLSIPDGTMLITTLEDGLNSDGDCSLREAITAANENIMVDDCGSGDILTDTIAFDVVGIIAITSQISVTAGGPLVIDGGEVITISGGGTTRVWWVETGSDLILQNLAVMDGYVGNDNGAGLYNKGGGLTIDQCDFVGNHFTISDSVHYYGGGIYSEGGILNVFDSRFEDNGSGDKYSHGGGIANKNTTGQIIRTTFQNNSSAGCWQGIPCSHPGGGGYYQSDSSMTIRDSIFISNTATYGGGGVTNEWGPLTITNSIFSGNSGRVGGGISNNGKMTITNCTISGNISDGAGGGIFNTRYITITNSTFSDNNASGGGGIFNTGDMTITNSTFSKNNCNKGGGIYNDGDIIIANSTFSNNNAEENGGGIANMDRVPYNNTVTITNSTFTGNHAVNSGGGIYNGMVEMTITNCTFSNNNTDGDGGGIYNEDQISPLILILTNSIVANSISGGDCYGTIADGGHNISSDDSCGFDPANGSMPNTDPLLGPLQDNGGPTWTHALLAGSPAIDAGDDAQCPLFDQRGIPRPIDGNWDGITICDIGSFEYYGPPLPQIYLPLVNKIP
jgi:CSLREA domain-containing protein